VTTGLQRQELPGDIQSQPFAATAYLRLVAAAGHVAVARRSLGRVVAHDGTTVAFLSILCASKGKSPVATGRQALSRGKGFVRNVSWPGKRAATGAIVRVAAEIGIVLNVYLMRVGCKGGILVDGQSIVAAAGLGAVAIAR
jgi:hypothetical protein